MSAKYLQDWEIFNESLELRTNKLRYYENYEDFTANSVNQETTIYTAVTLNKPKGVINTQNTTTGTLTTGISTHFTVNNSVVTSSSVVYAHIVNYSGTPTTNGIPVLLVKNITNGAFDIYIMNASSPPSATALSGTLKIYYEVINHV